MKESNKEILVKCYREQNFKIIKDLFDKFAKDKDQSTDFNIAILYEEFISDFFGIQDEIKRIKESAANMKKLYNFKAKTLKYLNYEGLHKSDIGNEEIMNVILSKDLYSEDFLHRVYSKYKSIKISEFDALFMGHKVENLSFILFDLPKQLNIISYEKNLQMRYDVPFDVAFNHANYCIKCKKQQKDYCTISNPKISIKNNGCPLKQEVSDMMSALTIGNVIASLLIIMKENKMPIVTGHRICNHCMYGCIFQKQTQVNVPASESYIVKEVLSLKYGVEIYLLMSLFNPLDDKFTYFGKYNENNKIAVAGLGPAGFSFAYLSAMLGFDIIAFDGMLLSKCFEYQEIFNSLVEDYDNYVNSLKDYGFGGVMNYGITSRWDKELLHVVFLLLFRMKNITIMPNFKLNGNVDENFLKEHNVDLLAIATGASRPNILNFTDKIDGFIYTASEILMQINLNYDYTPPKAPIFIIGAGLTAIDCAVELCAKTGINPKDITIVYHSAIENSSSYKTSKEEFYVSLEIGVNIIEEATVNDIIYEKNIIIINGKEYFANSIIYAIGYNHVDNFNDINIKKIYLGDANKNYAGSVVKALKSAKDAALYI
jgi:hypothetical protein